MAGRFGRGVWSAQRKKFNHRGHGEPQRTVPSLRLFVGLIRMFVARICVEPAIAFVLLTGCVFAQGSSSVSNPPLTSTSATPVSRPIDLTPDATSSVPPERI